MQLASDEVELCERLVQEENSMSTYVTGFTRDAKSQNVIEFASDLAPDTWISIPRGLIENIKELPGKAAQGAHIRVGIKLAEPTSPEGKVLAALTDGLNTAIVSLSRKVAPALDSTGKATHASDSCIRCLEACKLIVLPPDDPFAQIACMLGCADCP
ncbi:hypothetical protein DXU06_36525 [Bradyrhizobium elkanii]